MTLSVLLMLSCYVTLSTGTNAQRSNCDQILPQLPCSNMTQIPLVIKCKKPKWSTEAITVGTGLNNPRGLFIDLDDTIYVADEFNHSVQHFTPGSTKGVVVAGGKGAGNGSAQLNYPSAVFVDANKNLYVLDRQNYRVQKFSHGSEIGSTVAGGEGAGAAQFQLNSAFGLFVDQEDQVFVSDTYNGRVLKFPRQSLTGTVVLSRIDAGSPTGIYIDACNSLYLADSGNWLVRKYPNMTATFGETLMGVWGERGSGSEQLKSAQGLTVDLYGNVFVSDQSNHRIQRWSVRDGKVQTVAGVTGINGKDSQHLYDPLSVGLDSKGNLLVTDWNNYRIQKFDFISGDFWC